MMGRMKKYRPQFSFLFFQPMEPTDGVSVKCESKVDKCGFTMVDADLVIELKPIFQISNGVRKLSG